MKLFSLYRVELRRLLQSRPIWIITILCLCALLPGYSVFTPSSAEVMSGKYIVNPVLAGTVIGAILWAVITILETDRLHRSSTDVLTDSIASPISLSAAKTLAMMTISVFVTVIVSLLYLPFTAAKMEYLFAADFYFAHFLVFMLPTWWISILFADAFYQITRRIELSVMLYAVLAYFSFSGFVSDDYFMCWLNPLIVTCSDGFPSYWPLRIGIYTRMIWLAIALGAWLMSLMCIRRYQKNLVSSFVRGLKKVYFPVAAMLCISAGAFLWVSQPFIDHGPEEYDENYYDKHNDVPKGNVSAVHYLLKADPMTGKLSGRAEYRLISVMSGENMLTLNAGYKITRITYDDKDIEYETRNDDTNGERSTIFTLPDTNGKRLVVEYEGFPTVARYMLPSISDSIDPDYISLMGASIAPDMMNYNIDNKNTTFEITIPDGLIPIFAHEQMMDFTVNNDGTKTWKRTGEFIGLFFSAGKFVIDSFSAGEAGIDFAYGKIYEEPVQDYDIRQSVVDVFDYCSRHYGESSYNTDKRLLMIQRSAMFGGGFAAKGFCEWSETYLSPETLKDADKGANSTEVFIHEMIHQWWGGFGLKCLDDGLWSDEGLTVYSTYRLVKEKYGRIYAQQYYIDEWQKAVDEQNRNFYNRYPEYFEKLPKKYQANINESNLGTNLYKRMPLMILKAEELVGGEEKMDEILRKMYADRASYDYGEEFTYQDFLNYCGLTEEDLCLE